MKKWKKRRNRNDGEFRVSRGARRRAKYQHQERPPGLTYAEEGQTVDSLQGLATRIKEINLKILLWPKDPEAKGWTVIKVSGFENRDGQGLCVIGLDARTYDDACIPGNTPLYAYSY